MSSTQPQTADDRNAASPGESESVRPEAFQVYGGGVPKPRRRYWALPITHVSGETCDNPLLIVQELLEKNIAALDSAFGKFAREQILRTTPDPHGASLCQQSLFTLRVLRDVFIAICRQSPESPGSG